MATERSISDKVWLILKGLAMGAANKVPGVSGGVVAFVAGFYEEFIYSLQKINGKALKLLLNKVLSRKIFLYINLIRKKKSKSIFILSTRQIYEILS